MTTAAGAGCWWTCRALTALRPGRPTRWWPSTCLLGRRGDVPPPDVVLCVVAANNLERNLYLVSQVLELGRPTVVALTMVDVAQHRGWIDAARLGPATGRAGGARPGPPRGSAWTR